MLNHRLRRWLNIKPTMGRIFHFWLALCKAKERHYALETTPQPSKYHNIFVLHVCMAKEGHNTLETTSQEGDVAQWLERLTASPVMHASRIRTPLFPCGVFREKA